MNNLDSLIMCGEVVVVKMRGEDNLFVCENGYGMRPFSRNSSIYGYFVKSGQRIKIDGWDIDVNKTVQYQERFGKFLQSKPKVYYKNNFDFDKYFQVSAYYDR